MSASSMASIGEIAAGVPDLPDTVDVRWDERKVDPFCRDVVKVAKTLVSIEAERHGSTARMARLEALRLSVVNIYDHATVECGVTWM